MPKFDPKIHHRRSIRLPGYDYTSACAYFVTLVAYQRDCLLGEIVNAEMILNALGQIADECWRAIPAHFPNVELGAHVVMPNHVHGIIVIRDDESATVGATNWVAPTRNATRPTGPKRGSLGAIIGSYKMAVTRRIQHAHNTTGIWQRNYHEHIIRNEREMNNIWKYIEANPAQWNDDDENPLRSKPKTYRRPRGRRSL
jgi:REP element-mobilizing transposase RayT